MPNNQKVTSSTHKGQEFVYVLEGTLTLVHNDEEYNLESGDSFHMDSMTPHTWFNHTNEAVKLLYVYSISSNVIH
ncbi:cupin domain-containing protein [Cytobacillus depressus]|uniref:cupin domain-containing protein n=1 Tax=Cytobacillus depressus TaxID=1602942 RepID=UPI003CCD28C5